MSLLDSFTGPKWQHSNPEVRKDAVAQLDDADVLLELVNTDPDPAVQAAALSRIDDPETLDALIDTLPGPLQQQAKIQRLQQILPDADRLEEIDDDSVLLRIVSLSDDQDLLAAAVGRVGSDAVRLDLACSHPLATVRMTAARGIENLEVLDSLMRRTRGHDKAVFRHCKTRLDEHHAVEAAAAERQERIRHLCEKAGELAEAVASPDYESDYRVLVAQWKQVGSSADAAQRERFQRAQARCAQRLVRLADVRAEEEQAEADVAAARRAFPAVIEELDGIELEADLARDDAARAQLEQQLDELENRWGDAKERARPTPAQTQSFQQNLALWRSVGRTARRLSEKAPELRTILDQADSIDSSEYTALHQLIGRLEGMLALLPWPEACRTRTPDDLAQLQQAMNRLQNQFAALEKNQTRHAASVQKLVDALRTELEHNRSKEAERLLVRARKAVTSLAPGKRQAFEQELAPLAARLQEIRDWQAFAIEPKKVELCARMSALIGSGEDVDTLAVKIKSLQDEWKQLGGLPNAREHALWLEFKTTADEAWKPCKKVFAQRAALRRKNFAKRMELVAQLKEYEARMAWPGPGEDGREDADAASGAAPDWRTVQKTLDVARAAFRDIKPLDQKQERISHKAFRAVCDRIYSHIKHEYARNITLKERLLSSAGELVEAEDLQQAIDGCKRLQREWKEVGITPVAVDRRLWKAFRSACDAVFARLEEQRAHHSAELEARIKQAESLRDRARTLLGSEDDEQRLRLNKDLSELKQQFHAMELPAGVRQRLSREFRDMEGQAREIAGVVRHRREQARWARLIEKIKACALKSTDAAAATSAWQTGGDLPAEIDTEALEAFWGSGSANGSEEALRDACIGLEIHGELESPAEDKAARMNYQMQRLAAGMGRRGAQNEPALAERINTFIALRPSLPWAQRFCLALETITAGRKAGK